MADTRAGHPRDGAHERQSGGARARALEGPPAGSGSAMHAERVALDKAKRDADTAAMRAAADQRARVPSAKGKAIVQHVAAAHADGGLIQGIKPREARKCVPVCSAAELRQRAEEIDAKIAAGAYRDAASDESDT
jgi:hypothetical protein